jgi:hypothetical protein
MLINHGGMATKYHVSLQVEGLRIPLSKLLRNHTKDVAAAAAQFNPGDIRTIVDFLDVVRSLLSFSLRMWLMETSKVLKNHISLSDQRNRILALLSRITTSTHIFPRRYELNGIKYHNRPIASGGFGTVHRGASDPNICVKVMAKVDSKALMVCLWLFTHSLTTE